MQETILIALLILMVIVDVILTNRSINQRDEYIRAVKKHTYNVSKFTHKVNDYNATVESLRDFWSK